MKIIENVYLVPKVVANPFIIADTDGLTLIDVGIPFSEKKILAYIASIGKSPHDLKRIILTHSDVDHVGSLAALQKSTGARTYASPGTSHYSHLLQAYYSVATQWSLRGIRFKVQCIQVSRGIKQRRRNPSIGKPGWAQRSYARDTVPL